MENTEDHEVLFSTLYAAAVCWFKRIATNVSIGRIAFSSRALEREIARASRDKRFASCTRSNALSRVRTLSESFIKFQWLAME